MTQQQLLQPLKHKGDASAPLYEGLFVFLNQHDNQRYQLYISSTLAGNLISQKSPDINPWINVNARLMPPGKWFGPFYDKHDSALFVREYVD